MFKKFISAVLIAFTPAAAADTAPATPAVESILDEYQDELFQVKYAEQTASASKNASSSRKRLLALSLVIVLTVLFAVAATGCDSSLEATEPSSSTTVTESVIMKNMPSFPLTFTMTKYGADGTQKGDHNITIKADTIEKQDDKLYLNFSIADFDGITRIIASKSEQGYAGEVFAKWDGYHYVMCFGDEQWFRVCFDSEYDRWALYVEDGKPFYVGSVSGKYTNQELITYFRFN